MKTNRNRCWKVCNCEKSGLQGIAVACLLLLVLLSSSGCIDRLIHPDKTVITPRITPDRQGPETLTPVMTFTFEERSYTIGFPIDASVYRGAKAANMGVIIYGNISDNVWIPAAYRSIMNDPYQEQFYQNLISAFRGIRDQEGLDKDEYLELMTVFIQSLTYEIRNRNDPRFPIETYTDGKGDCDDKSLLLAGLLSREGYRVALLSFGPESHMAVGVSDGTSGYQDTGYAYIETTEPFFVGVPPDLLRGDVKLTSQPFVIPIGNGTLDYSRTAETQSLRDTFYRTGVRAQELKSSIDAEETAISQKKVVLDQLRRELDDLRVSSQIALYNTRASEFNSLVADYNRELSAYRAMRDEYNRNGEIHNYILTHTCDRKGTYAWVQAHMNA
jgi:hypothetical protein